MMQNDLITLGISVGLGLLTGLQREYTSNPMAGIRTFTLTAVLGTLCALIARHFDSEWMVVAGVIGVSALLFIANFLKKNEKNPDIGLTTEVGLLLMFVVGAYLVFGNRTFGVVVGSLLAVLLYLKERLTKFTAVLGDKDIRVIFQFAAISLVVLPILPDEYFGPYEVLNLRQIWLMVVLIVGLSVAGYFCFKWMGKDMGTAASGILGGLISSTATTLTYARRTKKAPGMARLAAFIIAVASTISFVRVIIEVAVVTPANLPVVAPPLVAMSLFLAVVSVGLYFYNPEKNEELHEPENPAQLKTALVFGLLYALIVLAVAAAKDFFGQGGLLAVSIFSGLTDMDAITLSLSNSMQEGRLEPASGWRLILVAGMSNLLFKGCLAVAVGEAGLRKLLGLAFGLALLAGGLILWLWR